MKKEFLHSASAVKRFFAVFPLVLTLLATTALPVRANSELDRRYALETVGFLRAWDNMDGLFGDYVSVAYKEYFSTQSRFILQDLSKADALLARSKMPYVKLIEDSEILGQIARSMRSESIIRTKVYKEGALYRFVIEWLHSPKMDLISTDTFTLEEPRDGKAFGLGDLKGALHQSLSRMIAKLPFVAHVTGRDDSSVTVNIGANAQLKVGDTLLIATIDEVKKHPLMRALVDWRLTQTGRVVVDSIDEGIAFCKVLDEEPGRQIGRYQKVTQISSKPVLQNPEKEVVIEDEDSSKPQLGWGSGSLWLGSFSRQYSADRGMTGKTGDGFFIGAKTDNQLWLTREFFVELGLGYGYSGYSQTNIEVGVPSSGAGVTATVLSVRADVGYTYFSEPNFSGPKAWAKLGYHSVSYTLPDSLNEATGPSSFKGVFFGVGGDFPIRGKYGALLNLDFGLMTTAEQTGVLAATLTSATAVDFFVGGYWRVNPKTTVRVGLDLMAHGGELLDGASLTHRVFSLGPTLLFYF